MTPGQKKVPVRRFGRTEIEMPVYTCGGMRFQQGWEGNLTPADIRTDEQERLEKTVFRALELGVRHIETARGYGPSEMQLGLVLPRIPRERYILQTKVGPKEDPMEFVETFEVSMSHLKADYVDLLGIHGINDEETLAQGLRCLDAARELQRQGRVRHVGFSTHGWCGIIERAIEEGDFDYVNLHWYFVQQRNRPAIEAAARRDMGVFIISPNDKGGMLYQPSEKLKRLCGDLTPMAFNDLFCLTNPQVHTLSQGASCPEDFEAHIQALRHYDRAGETVAPVAARLAAAVNAVCGPDWWETFEDGLPEFFDVPGRINLLDIVRLWTLAKGLDLVEYGRMRYNLFGNGGPWFPGSNAAEFDESTLRAALREYPYRDRIPAILREAHEWLFTGPVKRLSES